MLCTWATALVCHAVYPTNSPPLPVALDHAAGLAERHAVRHAPRRPGGPRRVLGYAHGRWPRRGLAGHPDAAGGASGGARGDATVWN